MTKEVLIQNIVCQLCGIGRLELICYLNGESLICSCKNCGHVVNFILMKPSKLVSKKKVALGVG